MAPRRRPDWGTTNHILALSDGGVALAGVHQSATGKTRGGNAQSAPWVAHLDAAGNPVWIKDYPEFCGDQDTRTVGFAAVTDGGFLLGWYGPEHMGTSAQGRPRLDAAGAVLWDQVAHGANILPLADGGVATTGGLCPALDRLDAAGTVTWSTAVVPCDFPGSWAGQSLASLADGDFATTALPLLPDATSFDTSTLVRVTPSGTVRWSRYTSV